MKRAVVLLALGTGLLGLAACQPPPPPPPPPPSIVVAPPPVVVPPPRVVPAAPVVVVPAYRHRRWICPRGYHLGPYHRRCVLNRR